MTKEKLAYKIRSILVEITQLNVSISKGTLSDYGLDSMQIVEVCLKLENEYKIDIPDDLVERWYVMNIKEISNQIIHLIN